MISKVNRERLIPPLILVVSGLYYYLLSSKIFTWVYTSGDAGDWLAAYNWWYVPHQWGKPLVLLLVRFVSLFPGDPVTNITIALAVIPGAVTVMFTYLIAKELTLKTYLSVVSALAVMSAVIFTTQATVLEQYAFTAMFVTIAFYFHVRYQPRATVLFLALATATHMVGAAITILWAVCNIKEWRGMVRLIPIYFVIGVLPYGIILGLMADPDTPKLIAGGLSFSSINNYLGNSTSGANLALTEAPRRLIQATEIIGISMGLCIVPIVAGIKQVSKVSKFAIVIICFMSWFYMTNMFPSVWKWLAMILPIACAYVTVGLMRLERIHTYMVTFGLVALVVVNFFCFNANIIAHEDSQATEYMAALDDLPDNSCVIVPRGGMYGFAVFYAISEGYNIIPILQASPYNGMTKTGSVLIGQHDTDTFDQSYADYLAWLYDNYGLVGDDMYSLVDNTINAGYSIYYGQPVTDIWNEVFLFDDKELAAKPYLYKVISINPDPDFSRWLDDEE